MCGTDTVRTCSWSEERLSGNLHFSFIVFPGFVKRLFQILRRNKAQSVKSVAVIRQ